MSTERKLGGLNQGHDETHPGSHVSLENMNENI